MTTITFTELRNHAKTYFDQVENGEVLEVLRRGKPIAILSPIRPYAKERWKDVHPMKIKGFSLSKAILKDREDAR